MNQQLFKNLRVLSFMASIVVALLLLGIMSLICSADGQIGQVFLGMQSDSYPFTIQNFMTLLLMAGIGEILTRSFSAHYESSFMALKLLPQDDSVVLQLHDLSDLNLRAKKYLQDGAAYLPHMINRTILQFQSARSIDQASNMLETLTELYAHRIDLKYSILRYIAWAIPTFGFIGTVTGISQALLTMDGESGDLSATLVHLSYAFDTTFISLVYSAVLMLLIHIVQAFEEGVLNRTSEYCLSNLINRLYV